MVNGKILCGKDTHFNEQFFLIKSDRKKHIDGKLVEQKLMINFDLNLKKHVHLRQQCFGGIA